MSTTTTPTEESVLKNDTTDDIEIITKDEVELLDKTSEEEDAIKDSEVPQEPKITTIESETEIESEGETLGISEVPQQETPISQKIHLTTYKGKPVRYIELTGSKIDVPSASIYTPGALSLIVDGIMDSFRVSCNDSNFRIFCQLKDHEGGIRTIINDTVDDLALDGAGMTSGEIEADVTSSAMDKTGTFDPVNPYIMRGKNQFSGTEIDYETNLGTINDKYLVINYSPINQLEFSRIQFYIENTSTAGTRRIHKYRIRYMEFVSEDTPIPDIYVLPSQLKELGIEIDIAGDDPELDAMTDLVNQSITGEEAFVKETLRKPTKNEISIEVVEDTDEVPINIA